MVPSPALAIQAALVSVRVARGLLWELASNGSSWEVACVDVEIVAGRVLADFAEEIRSDVAGTAGRRAGCRGCERYDNRTSDVRWASVNMKACGGQRDVGESDLIADLALLLVHSHLSRPSAVRVTRVWPLGRPG